MIPPSSEINVLITERPVARTLIHPGFSEWRKQPLRTTFNRDSVVLANDLARLQHPLLLCLAARIAHDQERRGTHWRTGRDARDGSRFADNPTVPQKRASWTQDPPGAGHGVLIRARRRHSR